VIKRIVVGIVGLIILGFIVLLLLAWEGGIERQSPPSADSFSQEQIDRGQVMAGIGNCQSCHTTDPDQPYAGGLAFETEFGTLYSTNITPDPDTGIGQWSQEAFNRAMREGVSRDGSHLFPAFPYTHFANVSDGDLEDLYAYMMTREAINAEPPENTLRFPFSIRMLQAGWKLLYFDGATLEEDASRGEYLAEGLGHCSACHTPRNLAGGRDIGASFAGNAQLPGGSKAPAIRPKDLVKNDWTVSNLAYALQTGITPSGDAFGGSMAEVVREGTRFLTPADREAMALFLLNKDTVEAENPASN